MLGEIKILSTVGLKGAIDRCRSEFESSTDRRLAIEFNTTNAFLARIRSGETFDATLLTQSAIEDLTREQVLSADAAVNIASSIIGMAVRSKAPKPNISTVRSFRDALLAARTIAYSRDGAAGGAYFADVLKRLGIEEAVRDKIVLETAGGFVAVLVARGQAELGIQLLCEIIPVDGADLVGPIPDELQKTVVLAAGVNTKAADAEGAKAFLRFLADPLTALALIENGMKPCNEAALTAVGAPKINRRPDA